MRFSVVLVPVFLLLAGTGYFIARPKENSGLAAVEARLDRSAAPMEDRIADQYDAELVRNALRSAKLSEADSTAMVSAAGRRYMRRKMAYTAAVQAGTATSQTLDALRKEMDLARRVCDLTESLGRHTDVATLQADIEMERRLAFLPYNLGGLAEHHDGRLTFTDADLKQLEHEFLATFGRPLPVSARGDSAVHRAMGFDHRGRTDVAVRPDTTEGVWIRRYLTGKGVSFFAFRGAVAGKATGAHIHIGPASGKVHAGV
ncbi:MAG: hypothetical protein JWP63_1783 [Candidatus Solibacter sp.]|nr:hypothetical protein [Candidatus Solibacter sp.]